MKKNWREIIRESDRENFVGRKDEINSFKYELSNPPRKLIFFISGQGGVGKTALLNQFQEIARELNYTIAESD